MRNITIMAAQQLWLKRPGLSLTNLEGTIPSDAVTGIPTVDCRGKHTKRKISGVPEC